MKKLATSIFVSSFLVCLNAYAGPYEDCLANCAAGVQPCIDRGSTPPACFIAEKKCENRCDPTSDTLYMKNKTVEELQKQSVFWLYKNFEKLANKHSGNISKADIRSEIIKLNAGTTTKGKILDVAPNDQKCGPTVLGLSCTSDQHCCCTSSVECVCETNGVDCPNI